ncbi:MAG: hypothetical protein ACYCRE_08595, partial [Acidobacteriaceae bacterium]
DDKKAITFKYLNYDQQHDTTFVDISAFSSRGHELVLCVLYARRSTGSRAISRSCENENFNAAGCR